MLALLKLDGIALGFAGADLIALPVVIAILGDSQPLQEACRQGARRRRII